MKRNNSCNLELQLLPPSSDYKSSYDRLPMLDLYNNGSEKQKQKKLTIFYNGKMVSCDVTELQARAIILQASRGNKEISKFPFINSSPNQMMQPQQQQQLYAPTTTLSMKKSLQQFLQKRKNRLQAASPYNHHSN